MVPVPTSIILKLLYKSNVVILAPKNPIIKILINSDNDIRRSIFLIIEAISKIITTKKLLKNVTVNELPPPLHKQLQQV